MRWRITWNRFTRSGITNQALFAVVVILAILASTGGFVFAAFFGRIFLAKVSPFQTIYVWDVIVLSFLVVWSAAILTELQRSEVLSFKNLLHLPVSLFGAFFLNYISSLVSVTILLIVPTMLGLAVACVIRFGAWSAVTFGLIISFLFMVTAVSYQLRGWLARLMENKRTRGTVIVVTTLVSVLLFQIPMMLNSLGMKAWVSGTQERQIEKEKTVEQLNQTFASGEIDEQEHQTVLRSILNDYTERELAIAEKVKVDLREKTTLIHRVLPPLWLPYGAAEASGGRVFVPLLCLFGMSAIGLTSLSLSYRSTRRASQGDGNKKYRAAKGRRKTNANKSMLQWSVPLLSDTQSAVMMATIRTTFHAPEAKMALMTPLIFAFIFGSVIVTGPLSNTPTFVRPWITLSAIVMSLVGVAQLQFNMFGLDRQGFRAYVLMPVARRDILIGKNLGILAIGGVLATTLVFVVGLVVKIPPSHHLANVLQVVIASLLFSTATNFVSIFAPMAMASGSMKPKNIKFTAGLLQFSVIVGCPLVLLPASIALGSETLLNFFYDVNRIPIYLIGTLVELPLAILFYRVMVQIQGQQLQDREQAILQEIAKVSE